MIVLVRNNTSFIAAVPMKWICKIHNCKKMIKKKVANSGGEVEQAIDLIIGLRN